MELDEFVRTTLVQILKGVRDAQEENGGPDRKRGIIVPYAREGGKHAVTVGGDLVTFVQFDVAVTTEAADNVQGGGKISVWNIARVGAEGSVSSRDTMANRIKFDVPIMLPSGDG